MNKRTIIPSTIRFPPSMPRASCWLLSGVRDRRTAWHQQGPSQGISGGGHGCLLAYLEFQLHCSDALAQGHLAQLLEVSKEVACGYLGVAAGGCLQQGLVDEDVLVLGLHHVVTLRSHARHVAIDVDRLLMLHPLQHGIDDNEAARPAHASAAGAPHSAGVSTALPESSPTSALLPGHPFPAGSSQQRHHEGLNARQGSQETWILVPAMTPSHCMAPGKPFPSFMSTLLPPHNESPTRAEKGVVHFCI